MYKEKINFVYELYDGMMSNEPNDAVRSFYSNVLFLLCMFLFICKTPSFLTVFVEIKNNSVDDNKHAANQCVTNET